jgi:hypothetical protein
VQLRDYLAQFRRQRRAVETDQHQLTDFLFE